MISRIQISTAYKISAAAARSLLSIFLIAIERRKGYRVSFRLRDKREKEIKEFYTFISFSPPRVSKQ